MNNSAKSAVTIPALPIGNIGAIVNMVRRCGGVPQVTQDPEKLFEAERIILSGVGAFEAGMTAIKEGSWEGPLNSAVLKNQIPVLGICLGMQLMCRASEEGNSPGLGWVPAEVKKLPSDRENKIKIPHMGWNEIKIKQESPLFASDNCSKRFYFVHSYHVVCESASNVLATTNHGISLTAAIRHKNIYGTQFHPEKSHRFGMELIENFLKLHRYA